MISLGSSHRYFLCRTPTDMRKSFDGLCALVINEMKADPFNGSVFIFINRRRNRIKLLVWDRSGFVLFYKRLEEGTFEMPNNHDGTLRISWASLVMLFEGIPLVRTKKRKRYRRQ